MSERDEATLPDPRQTPSPSGRTAIADLGERYDLGAVLGRGGMGEVRIARDTRIHRDVAVKLLRSVHRDDETIARFFREARVQGVLEHPAVVPVHDLGIDPAGNPYFVMKRLTGTTLADVLASSEPEVRRRWSRRVLLAKLVDVCLAVEFAHTRGVIHRDLKPANLMLGDFGEAYVLDWGLARVSGERDTVPEVGPLSGEDISYTAAGDMLGTPGYMSPEQVRGDTVDTRTDVFALGCVLFEILAGAPALPRGLEGATAALSSEAYRPSTRAGDVPPELDDLCARATVATASSRPTARQFADAIQAYLDGDRDTARRREVAAEHAQVARDALRGQGDDARATAMREAGRALALDPTNAVAQNIVGRLMLVAPTTIPAEARVAADAEQAGARQKILRWASRGYAATILSTCVLFLFPLHAYWPVGFSLSMGIGSLLVATRLGNQPTVRRDDPWLLVLFLFTTGLFVGSGLLFGSLLVMPLFMIGGIAAFLAQPSRYHWSIPVLGFVVPFVAMLGLELAGMLPTTVRFEDGALILTTATLKLTPLTTTVILGLSLVNQISTTVFVSLTRNQAETEARDLVHAQTWHLKQLLPHDGLTTAPVPKVDLD